MKQLILIITFAAITAGLKAQAPEKLNYQAVIRNDGGTLLVNSQIGMQSRIIQGDPVSGTAVYEERQTPTTNDNGMVNVEIGSGTLISGAFETIDWTEGPYYIETSVDVTGGNNYTITMASQLLSVPYALHAKTASTLAKKYEVGQIDQGGHIVYVTPNGLHGLVVALQDQSSGSLFHPSIDEVNDPSQHDSIGQEYTDWRLPTLRELGIIHGLRNNIGGFSPDLYWSSTGLQANNVVSYFAKWFDLLGVEQLRSGTQALKVRAVRTF